MQHRDDKPGIDYPGYITLFGGSCQTGEGVKKAAVREIQEELEIILDPSQLKLWRVYDKKPEQNGSAALLHIFIYGAAIDITDLRVKEGQGFNLIHRTDDLAKYKLTALAREFIPSVFKINFKQKSIS